LNVCINFAISTKVHGIFNVHRKIQGWSASLRNLTEQVKTYLKNKPRTHYSIFKIHGNYF
jgi:hypothetical protein